MPKSHHAPPQAYAEDGEISGLVHYSKARLLVLTAMIVLV